MGFFGPPNVLKLKKKNDVEGLIRALSYEKDRDVGRAAAEALICIGQAAVLPLCEVLKSTDPGSCVFVIWTLGEIGDYRGIGPLSNALAHQNPYVRGFAAEALGKIRDARAVDALCTALKQAGVVFDLSMDVKQSGQLDIKSNQSAYQPIEKIIEALIKFGEASSGPLCSILIEAGSNAPLSAKDRELFERAAEVLVKIGEPAVLPLCAVLKDKHGNVCRKAAMTLTRIGKAAVKPLIDLLTDNDPKVSCLAASALAEIGDGQAVPSLMKALKSNHENLRFEAAKALIHIYKCSNLDEDMKSRIFSNKESIVYENHIDNDNNCFPHDDYHETIRFPD